VSDSVQARAWVKGQLKWPSRADQITAELREAILSGAYPPGTRLPPERELAEQLRVGRSTIREALQRLEHLDLLRIRHGEGVTVLPLAEANIGILPHLIRREGQIDFDLLAQLLSVQEALLCAATRLAVENGTDEQRSHACSLVERIANPATSHLAYLETCAELVSLLALASRNLVMHLVRKALWNLPPCDGEESEPRLRPPAQVLAPLAKDLDAAIREANGARAEDAVRGLVRAHSELILASLRRIEPITR